MKLELYLPPSMSGRGMDLILSRMSLTHTLPGPVTFAGRMTVHAILPVSW